MQRQFSTKKAVQALHTLRLYKRQQNGGNSERISRFGRHERAVRQWTEQRLKQSVLSSYFMYKLRRKLGLSEVILGITIFWL